MSKKEKGYFHLPGLFEFYELYKVFLPLFYHHREYFYDWCEIGSIYGNPEDCLWGGGRIGEGNQKPYSRFSSRIPGFHFRLQAPPEHPQYVYHRTALLPGTSHWRSRFPEPG